MLVSARPRVGEGAGVRLPAEAELPRVRDTAARFERFAREHSEEIGRVGQEMGVAPSVVAIYMFCLAERPPDERQIDLGVVFVHGGEGVNINIQHAWPSDHLLVSRLEAAREVAENFSLVDLQIERNSQLTSPGAVPMPALAEDAGRFLRQRPDRWLHGQFLTVKLLNTSPQGRDFSGILVCSRS